MRVSLKIIKSKRKTMSLSINSNAELIARVPLNYSKERLDKFIKEKSAWIAKYVKQAENNKQKFAPLMVANGETIVLFETNYTILIGNYKRSKIADNKIFLTEKESKRQLIALIKKLTLKYTSIRVEQIAKQFGFNYGKIRVGTAKTAWGSCNSKNNLTFTYKLALTPYFVVDYIIIHELCHTKVKNHSKNFYDLVSKCMPTYKLKEQWLKSNRGVINII